MRWRIRSIRKSRVILFEVRSKLDVWDVEYICDGHADGFDIGEILGPDAVASDEIHFLPNSWGVSKEGVVEGQGCIVGV